MNISNLQAFLIMKHTLCSHFQHWSSQHALGPEIIFTVSPQKTVVGLLSYSETYLVWCNLSQAFLFHYLNTQPIQIKGKFAFKNFV